MPCHYGSTAAGWIPVELVEADFEIGFSLIDLADSQPSDASRILGDAEAVYRDILARVERLAPERQSFQPLVEELRRAMDEAAARHRNWDAS